MDTAPVALSDGVALAGADREQPGAGGNPQFSVGAFAVGDDAGRGHAQIGGDGF